MAQTFELKSRVSKLEKNVLRTTPRTVFRDQHFWTRPEEFGDHVNKTPLRSQSDGLLGTEEARPVLNLDEIRALVRLVSEIENPISDVVNAFRSQLNSGVPLEEVVEGMLQRWRTSHQSNGRNPETSAQQNSP
jgi:hypothetical protein